MSGKHGGVVHGSKLTSWLRGGSASATTGHTPSRGNRGVCGVSRHLIDHIGDPVGSSTKIGRGFECSSKVAGLHVGIVDDVMTTGRTLDELAKMLKAAGACEVSCVVVARA